MKERPILFSGPMVRAILEGRKTQTRRMIKHQPPNDVSLISVSRYHPTVIDRHGDEGPGDEIFGAFSDDGEWGCTSPFGEPSDRLWVRETWSADFANHYPHERLWYAADNDRRHDIDVRDGVRGIYSPESREHVPFRWRPSIHMPRWASRITLEITAVRVERLQDISESDAIAEGIETFKTDDPDLQGMWRDYSEDGMASGNPVGSFLTLWDGINAARGHGWDANPWVWVVEFRRIES
ncbi:hypothetical protein [Burkholderia vietnamiensis]|uniref:hypothetical protein n=1 Tax=Burkholderia vietnamiensis TaxID=60552 RepID=UPI001CF5C20B|nr:hypothetical protein [Burkholderia vietnamiensis]MCA8195428.1 hypothetical protein [Burkholderia vietnamiensis]